MEGLRTRTSELIVLRALSAYEPHKPAFNLLDANESGGMYPH